MNFEPLDVTPWSATWTAGTVFTDAVIIPALEQLRQAGAVLTWMQPEGVDIFPFDLARATVDEDGEWEVCLFDPATDEWSSWWHVYPTSTNLLRDLYPSLSNLKVSTDV